MQDDVPSGPFGFVPCLRYRVGRITFERPTIDLDQRWIAPSFGRGARVISATPQTLRSLWDNVVAQVTEAGLALGIRLEVPPELRGATGGK